MSRVILLSLCFLVVFASAVAAPLTNRQRRQFGSYMGGETGGYGNQFDGYGDNDYGTGNNNAAYVSQANDNIQTGYGGYEDFGGYGGSEGGIQF